MDIALVIFIMFFFLFGLIAFTEYKVFEVVFLWSIVLISIILLVVSSFYEVKYKAPEYYDIVTVEIGGVSSQFYCRDNKIVSVPACNFYNTEHKVVKIEVPVSKWRGPVYYITIKEKLSVVDRPIQKVEK